LGWKIKIGDQQNGFTLEKTFKELDDLIFWLKKYVEQI
jgi:hypothetical protein